MSSIYLAAAYSSKEEIRCYAAELREMGFEVTAQWLNEPHAATVRFSERHAGELRVFARRDIDDISRSKVFLFFSVDPEQPTRRGGRHVELGLAIAIEKRVIVVGPRENIFHSLPEIEQVATLERCGATPPGSRASSPARRVHGRATRTGVTTIPAVGDPSWRIASVAPSITTGTRTPNHLTYELSIA